MDNKCEHDFEPPKFNEWNRVVYDELWCNEKCKKCGYETPWRFII
jgi:hypothetical protein